MKQIIKKKVSRITGVRCVLNPYVNYTGHRRDMIRNRQVLLFI